MDSQKRWWNLMNPDFALFKFRLPWDAKKLKYLQGEVWIQAFPGMTSTETRLFVRKGASEIVYDNQLFYHNLIARQKKYIHPLGLSKLQDDDVCNCYDCARMVFVFDEYVQYKKTLGSPEPDSKSDDIEPDHVQIKKTHKKSITTQDTCASRTFGFFARRAVRYISVYGRKPHDNNKKDLVLALYKRIKETISIDMLRKIQAADKRIKDKENLNSNDITPTYTLGFYQQVIRYYNTVAMIYYEKA